MSTDLDQLSWFQHRWLDRHGKNSHMKEARETMTLLRHWFESLDTDGSGELGVDELEDPLVSVGLARTRDEVQRLIDDVDKDHSGEITFAEFLTMMNREQPTRRSVAHGRRALHEPKQNAPQQSCATNAARTSSQSARGSANPVAKLFEDLQAGKLGDLAVPFPVLITAYRRRMLLNAHMAQDPAVRKLGSSVLQALENTRRDGTPSHDDTAASRTGRRDSLSSPSRYLRRYIADAGIAAHELDHAHTPRLDRTVDAGAVPVAADTADVTCKDEELRPTSQARSVSASASISTSTSAFPSLG